MVLFSIAFTFGKRNQLNERTNKSEKKINYLHYVRLQFFL